MSELDTTSGGSAPGAPAAQPDQCGAGPGAAGPKAQEDQVQEREAEEPYALWPDGATVEEFKNSAHDRLVRGICRKPRNAGPLLKFLLSGAADLPGLDFSRVSVVKLTLRTADSSSRKPDLLFRVPLVGSDEFVLIHIEHQSRHFKYMLERMLEYHAAYSRSWKEQHEGESVPRLIQILLCHDAQDHLPWDGRDRIDEGNGELTRKVHLWPGALQFGIVVRDLEVIAEARLRTSAALTAVPRAVLSLLKLAPVGRSRARVAAALPEWVLGQLRAVVAADTDVADDLRRILLYTMITGKIDPDEARRLASELGVEEEFVNEFDTLLMDREAKGEAKGVVKTLLQLVAAKWGRQGEPSKRTAETIRAGSDRQLRVWTSAILREDTVEGLLAAPDNPAYASK